MSAQLNLSAYAHNQCLLFVGNTNDKKQKALVKTYCRERQYKNRVRRVSLVPKIKGIGRAVAILNVYKTLFISCYQSPNKTEALIRLLWLAKEWNIGNVKINGTQSLVHY